ncbi:MAG TPA: hypothetical protein VFS56_02415 [Gemmatimonadaceae bacterium]|nr:hypothetical protein [Gemmatimonadaceae bacterium]
MKGIYPDGHPRWYCLSAPAGHGPERPAQHADGSRRDVPGAFVLLLAGWVLAAAAGAYVAARLATRSAAMHGLIVAGFDLVATVANLAAIPHPAWLWPAAIVLIPLAGWIAARLVRP